MNKYDLSDVEDQRLHNIVIYRNGRTLYEYMVEMPLEDLKAYPKKGYRWWMGRRARSHKAMELRDYVLYWRLVELDFRQKYSNEYLQSLSYDEMRFFLDTYIRKTPFWAYEGPVREVIQLLDQQSKLFDET